MEQALILIAGCVVTTAACGTSVVDINVEEPWIEGVITRIDAHDDRLRVLIEENPKVDEGTKISFSVTDETVLLKSTDQGLRPSSRASIEKGRRAAAVTYGFVLDSYPGQAFADTLIIYR